LPQAGELEQSLGQLARVSPGSHNLLPQYEAWQSAGQVYGLSADSQMPLPQLGRQ
jgi:hypothetical protein